MKQTLNGEIYRPKVKLECTQKCGNNLEIPDTAEDRYKGKKCECGGKFK